MDSVAVGGRGRLWRSRWAAMGAAVVVTLGGGGMFAVQAASSAPSLVVTIDPVRILDTRDPVNLGLPGPFVSAVSQKLQVTGPVVPAGATGVLLNVTAVRPSADGFLSVRPGDATGAPSTSSLNFTAGDIVPNSVQVGLPTTGVNAGQIDITYDAFGQAGPTTEVLIDVVGYTSVGGSVTGPAGPPGVGFRTDCADASMSVWNTTTSAWECRLALSARGTDSASSGTGYGANISSDNYRGMYVKGAAGYYDAYFAGDSGISTANVIDRSGAARTLAVNSGKTAIEPGDLVAIVGVAESSDGQPILGVARLDASNADAVIGVAEYAMSADPIDDDGAGVDSAQMPGSVGPNGYVVVITSGLAPAVNITSLSVAGDVSIGETLALSASGEMRLSQDRAATVEIGRVIGPIDDASDTIPMFIDIE